MDDPTKVSVIIPTYNREATLERAVKSVLSQTHKNLELIIIDDGSTDNTHTIIKKYSKKLRFFSQLHGGVSAARNLGLEKSEGTWVAFLDSDDYWLPEKLEVQLKFLREHPQIMVAQTEEIWIRNGIRVNPMRKHQKYGGWIFRQCLPLCIVSPSASIIHQKVLNDVGVFDESFPVCEDYDLWLRVSLRYQIGLIPEHLTVKTGGHSDQLSKRYWGMDRYRVRALEKILNMNPTPEQELLILSMTVEKLSILSKGREKYPDKPNIYKQRLNEYKKRLLDFTELHKHSIETVQSEK